jgi:hypothetical protein
MKLFDYMKVLFSTPIKWNTLKNYDKVKNSFMTNRFMSIKFPIQANLFNQLKTDPLGAAESWRMVASKFNRVPGWIYTRVRKTKKEKVWEAKIEAVEFYMKVNEIGKREYKEAFKVNPQLMKQTLISIEKQLGDDVH